MSSRCPEIGILLAAMEGRLAPPRAADWQPHLESCRECRRKIDELGWLGTMLGSLAGAERQAATEDTWAQVAARLERPTAVDRMPLPLADALRQVGALLQPPAAAGLAAALAGIALGTWLASSTPAASGANVAAEPYEVSSLLPDGSGGLADAYLSDEVEADPNPARPVDSQALEAISPRSGGPVSADSGGDAR